MIKRNMLLIQLKHKNVLDYLGITLKTKCTDGLHNYLILLV